MSVERVLVIGSNGLLGQKVAELLVRGSPYQATLTSIESKPVVPFQGVDYAQLDVTSKKDVRQLIAAAGPDVIINCAAMTNVDACEHERELAWRVNVGGVENLIEAARKNGSRIVHISTDYIFDGKLGPYTEDDRPSPLSYYGKTKLASENALRASGIEFTILRTMILYGYAPGVKANFALWLIENLENRSPVRVVDDQLGNPTLVDDLAYGLLRAVELGRTGIYNIAGRDIISRYDFARKLAQVFGFDSGLITPVKTAQLRQPAPRPLKSGLITLKAEVELGIKPSTVEQGLTVLKSHLSRAMKMISDSAPVAGGARPGRHGKR